MKRFMLKIFIFVMPILFFSCFLEFMIRRVPNEYSYKNDYLTHQGSEIEILVLGSSHGRFNIDPVFFSGESFNAAHSFQSLKYDSFVFNKFKAGLTKLKWVILPISYFTLFSELEGSAGDRLVRNYSIYYDYREHSSLHHNYEVLNSGPMKMIKKVGRYIWSGGKSGDINVSRAGMGKHGEREDFLTTAKEAVAWQTVKNFDSLKDNLARLDALIADCSKMGVKVFLFTSPAWHTYTDNLDEEQLNLMKTSIHDILSRHSNVEYHSFLRDIRFTEDNFQDADHLNKGGAKKLTEIINDKILANDRW